MSPMQVPRNSPTADATWLAPGTLAFYAVQGTSLVYTDGLVRHCIHGIHLKVMLLVHINY